MAARRADMRLSEKRWPWPNHTPLHTSSAPIAKPEEGMLKGRDMPCESEQQHVVILVRNEGLPQLDHEKHMW